MLKIFLSWSGDRSKQVAKILRKYLPLFLQRAEPWMSSVDLHPGKRWAEEVGARLKSHHVGIICVTPENRTAPWMLFEAGAISKELQTACVFPLLLGMNPKELDGPLSQFQLACMAKDDFEKLLRAVNLLAPAGPVPDEVLTTTFRSFWPRMEKELKKVAASQLEGTPHNINNVTSAFGKFGFPEPSLGNHVYFASGFESHSVYATAYELANQRLWIWGRKNRKVFDKEYKDFFAGLGARVSAGFDFKVLFLNPNSSPAVLASAHQDQDFGQQLLSGINVARSMCQTHALEFPRIAKAYGGLRNSAMVVVDDAILYSFIQYDKNGRALPLTKAPFSIVGAQSSLGRDLERSFLACWEESENLDMPAD